MPRAVGLHLGWAAAMAIAAVVWGLLAGDFAGGVSVWAVSIGIPLLLLGALVALPLNLLWAAALTIASRRSLAVVVVVLLLGTIIWFAIGWLYLGRAEISRAWESGAWTGIGGLLFGLLYVVRLRPCPTPLPRDSGAH